MLIAAAAPAAEAHGADDDGPCEGAAPLREVLPLLQAWRRAEALAAQIPNGDVMVGRGDSMLPVFPDSTVIVVQRMPMKDLRPGMVVVFVGDRGRPVAHTLVARTSSGWTAKGTANDQPDRTRVRSHNYLGTVVRAFVPFLPEATKERTGTGKALAGERSLKLPPSPAVALALSGT